MEPTIDTVVEPVAVAAAGPNHDGDRADGRTDDRANSRTNGHAEDVPPDNPGEAILWWRDKDPTLTLSQIAAKVGRSERTVRRILDSAAAGVAPASPLEPAAMAPPRRGPPTVPPSTASRVR